MRKYAAGNSVSMRRHFTQNYTWEQGTRSATCSILRSICSLPATLQPPDTADVMRLDKHEARELVNKSMH